MLKVHCGSIGSQITYHTYICKLSRSDKLSIFDPGLHYIHSAPIKLYIQSVISYYAKIIYGTIVENLFSTQ